MNSIEIVGETEKVPAHERVEFQMGITENFVDNGAGKPYTFRETGVEAFTDNGSTITSNNDSPAVAVAMVRLAALKGAVNLESNGTDRFHENAEYAMGKVQAEQAEMRHDEAARIAAETESSHKPTERQTISSKPAIQQPKFEGETADEIKARVARHNASLDHELAGIAEQWKQQGEEWQRQMTGKSDPMTEDVAVIKTGSDDIVKTRRRAEQVNQKQRNETELKDHKDMGTLAGTPTSNEPDEAETKRRNDLARDAIKAYVIDGNEYRTRGDNSRLVFRDNGKTITSKRDDEHTVKNEVMLMASRGVEKIKVSGTEKFKRNAWVAAQRHDMEVQGYKPTAQDIALHAKPENTMTDATNEKEAERSTAKQAAQNAESSATTQKRAPAVKGELSGVLTDHGAAPYQHNPDKKTSYYVNVSDNDGKERTQWGVDLESAVYDSGVQKGDHVTLRRVHTKDVLTEDENGQEVIGRRASWVIDSPQREAILEKEREQEKAAVLKSVGRTVADRVPNKEDADAINELISQRVDNHQGSLPEVPIYETERQAPVQVPQEQDKQRLSQRAS